MVEIDEGNVFHLFLYFMFCLFLFFFVICCIQRTRKVGQNYYYRAAVVEFHSNVDDPDIENNLKLFDVHIASYTAKQADIIVFPEFALMGVSRNNSIEIPDPNENIITCGDVIYSKILRYISCAAAKAKKYVVINVMMQDNCTNEIDLNCPTTGYYVYNTIVVFDRRGAIIATYEI